LLWQLRLPGAIRRPPPLVGRAPVLNSGGRKKVAEKWQNAAIQLRRLRNFCRFKMAEKRQNVNKVALPADLSVKMAESWQK